MSSCTLIHTKGIRCCLGVNIAFIKASHWDLRGQRGVCHFCMAQLVPGAAGGFQWLPALAHSEEERAHTLEELAASLWLLGSVSPANPAVQGAVCWTEGTQLPPKGGKCVVLISWSKGCSLSCCARWDLLRYSLTRILYKSHTCLAHMLQSRQ